jgi:hypothetical protein
MTTRLLPEINPDAGLRREEVAMLFDREDIDRGMELFNRAAREIPFAMRTDRETGEAEYRVSDVEAIALDWQGIKKAKRRPLRSSAPPPARIKLSDDHAPAATSSTGAGVDARSEAVAESIGLDIETGGRKVESKPPKPERPASKTDPKVDARAREVAERLGIDIGPTPAASDQGEPVTADATTQRVGAKPPSRTRRGAPRRWGQR